MFLRANIYIQFASHIHYGLRYIIAIDSCILYLLLSSKRQMLLNCCMHKLK